MFASIPINVSAVEDVAMSILWRNVGKQLLTFGLWA